MSEIRAGCCGFALSRKAYFERFSLVEVQQTFYHPPRTSTLLRWRAQAPKDFEFTMKAWQLITHESTSPTYRRLRSPLPESAADRCGSFRPSAEVTDAWRLTLEAARALRATVVVFQCPASFGPTADHIGNLRRFFRQARKEAKGLVLGWEPRGRWPEETVTALCRQLGIVRVLDPFTAPAAWSAASEPVRYFRLHGLTGYRYRYTDADLERLLEWCREAKTTYCLFNNLSMAEDAARFAALARRESSGK
jgi:uncharacterized protein YecE (DUF72 family)